MELTRDAETLRIRGRLDGRNTHRVRRALYDHIAATAGDVVVDLEDVESADVNALRMLAAAQRQVERGPRHLVLQGCNPALRRTVAITRMRKLIRLQREPVAA